MLIYVRYGAKAIEKTTAQNATDEAEIPDDADSSIATGAELDKEKTS